MTIYRDRPIKKEPIQKILDILAQSVDEQVEHLTRQRFTGILSIKLDVAFSGGGLRNIKKKIGHEETLQGDQMKQ